MDFDEIADLMPGYHEEMGEAPLDPDKVADLINFCIENHLLVVTRSEGRITGLIGLAPQEYSYSTQAYLYDVLFYVPPGYRGKGMAGRLLAAARHMAETMQLPLKIFVANPEKAKKRFRHVTPILGFYPTGYVHHLRG